MPLSRVTPMASSMSVTPNCSAPSEVIGTESAQFLANLGQKQGHRDENTLKNARFWSRLDQNRAFPPLYSILYPIYWPIPTEGSAMLQRKCSVRHFTYSPLTLHLLSPCPPFVLAVFWSVSSNTYVGTHAVALADLHSQPVEPCLMSLVEKNMLSVEEIWHLR